jgi:hypothetical protein
MKANLYFITLLCCMFFTSTFGQQNVVTTPTPYQDSNNKSTEEYCIVRIRCAIEGLYHLVMKSKEKEGNPIFEKDGQINILLNSNNKPFTTVESVLTCMNSYGWEAFQVIIQDLQKDALLETKVYTVFFKRKLK